MLGSTPFPMFHHIPHSFRRPLLLIRLPSLSNSLQNLLPILVGLQLGDDDFTRVDADEGGLAVGFLAADSFNVDKVFETVHGGDLALAALVGTSDNGDFVVFSDGDRSNL
jgi:hypothetical protein